MRATALATFRVLAKGDLDADAALASAVGSPAAEVADAAPATAPRPERPRVARVRRCRDCLTAVMLSGGHTIYVVTRLVTEQKRGRQGASAQIEAQPKVGCSRPHRGWGE
jgi:hypothetical protein